MISERYKLLLLNFLNLRYLLGVSTKLKENIFKKNNQINSTVTTRTWFFFDRMDQNVFKYKTGIRMKKWWWFPFA